MIKQLLGCRHLLCHKPNGFTIQIYLAIIAAIIIMSITGLATCPILDANSVGKNAANLASDDKAKTVPNTIGWKPIPRCLFSFKDRQAGSLSHGCRFHSKADRLEAYPTAQL
ncbi:MAG: hypothetical protein NTV29_13215 [Planctomycetota bacterium]|nr:hypothetical protein [Planctomycetota bacterium]